MCADRCLVSQRNTPNTIRAAPTTIRTHDAHVGALLKSPSRSETSTKTAVMAASATTHPSRYISEAGRGWVVCNTKTAGMIDSGDNVITNASGINSVSTDPVMVQNRRMRLAAFVTFAAVLTFTSTMQTAGIARADATADVLAQEARWL